MEIFDEENMMETIIISDISCSKEKTDLKLEKEIAQVIRKYKPKVD